jgi:energy-coupling factor transporter ATP-binding protein EcfA2
MKSVDTTSNAFDFQCARSYILDELENVSLQRDFTICKSAPLHGRSFKTSPAWCLFQRIWAMRQGSAPYAKRSAHMAAWANTVLNSPCSFALWTMLLGAIDGLQVMKHHHLMSLPLPAKIAFWAYFASMPEGQMPFELWLPKRPFSAAEDNESIDRLFRGSREERRRGVLAVAAFLEQSPPWCFADELQRLPPASLVTLFRNTSMTSLTTNSYLVEAGRKEAVHLLKRWSNDMGPLYAMGLHTLQTFIESKLGQTATRLSWAPSGAQKESLDLVLQWEGGTGFSRVVHNMSQVLRQVAHLANRTYDPAWFIGPSLTVLVRTLVGSHLWCHVPGTHACTFVATTRRIEKLLLARNVLVRLSMRTQLPPLDSAGLLTSDQIYARAHRSVLERHRQLAPRSDTETRSIPLEVQRVAEDVAKRMTQVILPMKQLNPEQRRAWEALSTKPFVAIHGPPGSGKTTLLRHLQSMETLPSAWMTGKEEAVLRESYRSQRASGQASTDCTASARTLIALPVSKGPTLLYLSPTNMTATSFFKSTGFTSRTLAMCYKHIHHEVERECHFLRHVQVLIMDEASMLGDKAFVHLTRIVSYLMEHGSLNRVVLVGDTLQLPSIQPGRPFIDLLTHCSFMEVVQLHRDMRTHTVPVDSETSTDTVVGLAEFKALARRIGIMNAGVPAQVHSDRKALLPPERPDGADRVQCLLNAKMPSGSIGGSDRAWPFTDASTEPTNQLTDTFLVQPIGSCSSELFHAFFQSMFAHQTPRYGKDNPLFSREVLGVAFESIDDTVQLMRARMSQTRGGGVVITFRNETCKTINRLLCASYNMDVFADDQSVVLRRIVPGLKLKVLTPFDILCKNEVVSVVGVQAILRLRGKPITAEPDIVFSIPASDTPLNTLPSREQARYPHMPTNMNNYVLHVGLQCKNQQPGAHAVSRVELPRDHCLGKLFGPGFCVTVDSMQGGEVENVIYALDRVPWPNLYTACTRGKKSVTFVHHAVFTQRPTYTISARPVSLIRQCADFHLKRPSLDAPLLGLLWRFLDPPFSHENQNDPRSRKRAKLNDCA